MEGRTFGEGFGEMPPDSVGNTAETRFELSKSLTVEAATFVTEKKYKNSLHQNRLDGLKPEEEKVQEVINNKEIKTSSIEEKILEKIINANITADNGHAEARKIISELRLEDKNLRETVLIEAGIVEQLEMDKRIAVLGNRKSSKTEIYDLLIERVRRTQAIENFIERHEKEPILLDKFWNHFDKIYSNKAGEIGENHSVPDRYGITASLGVKKLFKKLGIFHSEITAEGDVYDGIDGYLKINDEIIPYQVKCRSLNVDRSLDPTGKYGIDRSMIERQRAIEEEMVSVVSYDLKSKIENAEQLKEQGRGNVNFVSPIKKEIDREKNIFWEKIVMHNQNKNAKIDFKKGVFVVLPSGVAWDRQGRKINLLNKNGTVDGRVEELFIKRYNEKVLGIDNDEKSNIISNRKNRRKK